MSYSLISKERSHGSSTRSTSSSTRSTSSTNGDEAGAGLRSPTITSPTSAVFPENDNGPGHANRGGSEPPTGQSGSSTVSSGHRGSVVSVVSVPHQSQYKSVRSGGAGGTGGMFSPGIRRHSKGYRDGVGTKLSIVDIRQQLSDQLKCLDIKLDTEVAVVTELQEFFRRRAEVEQDYAQKLDKLVKTMITRHKTEKPSRTSQEQWATMSTYACWKHLIGITRKESQDHQTIADIYSNQMVSRLSEVVDNSQRIFRKCRDIGAESHEDMMKVLNELQSAMKTYHMYQNESKQAEMKLRNVEGQKQKVEQQLSGKNTTSRKLKGLERQVEKKHQKYTDNKAKALKARNDYLLCIDAANAAIGKYFSDDISDLMDCMDFGYHNSVGRSMMMYLGIHEHQKQVHGKFVEYLNKCITDLDSRPDKQKFMELNNVYFMLPKKFEYQPFKGDEVCQISAQKEAREDLIQRFTSIEDRLNSLKVENDEIWKTLETTERTLVDVIQVGDYDITKYFNTEEPAPPKSPHEQAKVRADRLETESYYLEKFREYTLSCNRLARLQSKFSAIQKALGDNQSMSGPACRSVEEQGCFGPPAPPPKPKKRRIGHHPLVGQPKLFGGSLEEYLEAIGQEIPLIIKSCIRIINLYGLHHQGVFRVSGAQVEINQFKTVFESGEDALADVVDASDINSVAGVLKLYFRELREPLFPLHLFDALVECTREKEVSKCVERIKDLLSGVNRAIFVVMRYLFAFLNHVTEYSDENMMDPYNLAICFGPTLLPIPPDRDQVTFQASVNEIIKIIISHQEEIFPNDGGEIYDKIILDRRDSVMVEDEDEETSSVPSDEEESYFEPDVIEATAIFDFEARSARELSFKHGDTLVLYHQASADWWEGCFQGKEGLIPDKYISVKQSDDSKSQHSHDDGDTSKGSSSSQVGAAAGLMTTSMTLPHRTTARQVNEESCLDALDKSLSQPNVAVTTQASSTPAQTATLPITAMIRETAILGVDAEETDIDEPIQGKQTPFSTSSHVTASSGGSQDKKNKGEKEEGAPRKMSAGTVSASHVAVASGNSFSSQGTKTHLEAGGGSSSLVSSFSSSPSSSVDGGARAGKTVAVVKPSPNSSPSATSMMMKSAVMTSSLIGAGGPRKDAAATSTLLSSSASPPVQRQGDTSGLEVRVEDKGIYTPIQRNTPSFRQGGDGDSPGFALSSVSSLGSSGNVVSPDTSSDDFGVVDIDTALQEVMAGLKSLEMQQKFDKRMSLPAVKVKQSKKHAPDIVQDLPDGEGGGMRSNDDTMRSRDGDDDDHSNHHHHYRLHHHHASAQQLNRQRDGSSQGTEAESPTISAAETFAQSNQGTLKKAEIRTGASSFHGHPSAPVARQDPASRLSISSEPGDVSRGASDLGQGLASGGPMSSFSLKRTESAMVGKSGRSNLSSSSPSSSQSTQSPHSSPSSGPGLYSSPAAPPLFASPAGSIHHSTPPPSTSSISPNPPPVAQKPKPPMKVKPPVMKKPAATTHSVQPPN